MNENRNLILAISLSLLVWLGWEYFVAGPQMHADRAHHGEQMKQQAPEKPPAAPEVAQAAKTMSRAQALQAEGASIAVDTPTLDGSIRLKGARFNNLHLKKYHETIDPKSPEITLFAPEGTQYPYFAYSGWLAKPGSHVAVPDNDTQWKLVSGKTLSPGHPVVLEWNNGAGLDFTRTISVDDQYMFSIADTVKNARGAAVTLFPFASVVRKGVPKTQHYWVLHEGFVGVGDGSAKYTKYDDLKPGETKDFESTGGWLGITDKYWMAASIPDQNAKFSGEYRVSGEKGHETYLSDYRMDGVTVGPGASRTVTSRLFAGAKVVSIIRGYETKYAIQKFDLAIDWGWFWFITKPIFWLLDLFYHYIGNFGVAILLLTVTIKAIFFPLANTSYKSMSRMKKLQPEMERLKQRFGDDRMRQQQEMMELYKREKVNPVSGCLPMLLQIPVFFSLYKVLFVTIEMRHAPFFGWIHDLSAPDPTSIINLFGLLPFHPPAFIPAFLSIGVWPVLMGITQWLQTKMNPAPADPVQARMFAFMPLIFTFMLATFPAGLVIYWTWNNLLSVTQQYVIMRRQGVKVHLFENLKLPKRLTAGE